MTTFYEEIKMIVPLSDIGSRIFMAAGLPRLINVNINGASIVCYIRSYEKVAGVAFKYDRSEMSLTPIESSLETKVTVTIDKSGIMTKADFR